MKQIQNAIKLSIAFPWYINVVRVPKTNETLVNRIISFINLLQRTNGFDANSSRQPLKAKQQPLFLQKGKAKTRLDKLTNVEKRKAYPEID